VPDQMKPLKPPRAVRSPHGLYALFALLFLALAVGGGWLYRIEQAAAERRIHANLEAVSRLKAEQIVRWREERLSDAADIASCRLMGQIVDVWLNQHRPEAREMILNRFQGLQQHRGLGNIMLVDAAGRLHLSLGGMPDELHPMTRAALEQALAEGRPVLSDLHFGPDDEHAHFDAVAPLFTPDGRPLGAVILVSLAEDFLYPLIRTWPTVSESAETLLVRREGDAVLFLNELRHRPGTALKLRIPLSDAQLPAARAIAGETGLVDGRDYRSVPVLAKVQAIPDTSWFMVTKIDAAEAYADWREHSLLLALLLAGFSLMALGGLLWLRRNAAHYRTLLQAETETRRDREQQATLRELLENTLKDGALREGLERCLKQLLGVSWLSILPKGGVFLMEEDGQSLRLAASHNLAPEMQALCSRLPLGHCLCGQAAESRELQYAACLDDRHDIHYPGMTDHGHYALPLTSEGTVLGVLVLYLPVGFVRDPMKEQFLASVADILAGLIRRSRQAEDLRGSEERYRRLVEASPEVLYTFSTRLGGLYYSAQVETVFGYSAEYCRAHPFHWQQSTHPEDRARVEAAMRLFLAGEGFDVEYRVRHRDGEWRWLRDRSIGRQQVGEDMLIDGLASDITEARQAEEALEGYKNQLEELVAERTADLAQAQAIAHVGSWRLDVASECLTWSGETYRIFGIPPDTPMNQESFAASVHPEDIDRVFAAWNATLSGSPYDIEHRIVVAGQVKWVRERAELRLDESGRPAVAIGTAQDISELKLAETATRQALVEAQRLAQVRSEFLANMSHEIRTPLNAVLGLAQMGERDSAHRKAQDNFRRIVDSGRHLLGVVNDILDFSKIEAGKLELEQAPFDLGEAIDQAVDLTAAQAYAKGLEFEVHEAADLPEQVQGDHMRLTQVLVNLLSNAVKFTEHGRVALEVERYGLGLVFRVRDSGIGMTPEQTARLFAAFEQGDSSTTRKYGGTGLGLAISKRLVDAMGGEVRVESRPGQGSLFEVRLPMPLPAAADQALECGRIRLAGLPAHEAEWLAAELARRGVEAEIAAPAQAFALPWPDRLIMPDEALARAELAQTAARATDDGLRLLLLVTPGAHRPLPEALQDRVTPIERPPRLRHLLCLADDNARAAERRGASARLAGLHVLAAEDVEVNRLVLEDVLIREGASVVFAEDGQQAVDRVREAGETGFDVVLMDIQMPVLDGYAATRQICELAPGLPVIGLTAHALAEERKRCLAAGMVEHLTKPIDVEALVAAILRHVLRPRGEGESIPRSSVGLGTGEVSPSPLTPLPDGEGNFSLLPQGEGQGMRVKRMDTGMASDPATPAGVFGMNVAQPIDWPTLEARFPGRPDFVAKLAATVLENNTATPARLRELAAGRDYAALAFLAHSLKGMGGNLMAHDLHDLARQAEDSARAGQTDAPALAEALAEALEVLLAALRERTR